MTRKITQSAIIASLLLASALPALAQTTANTTTKITAPKIDSACMQTAVGKRDEALVSDFGAYSSTITSLFQTREAALKAGWALTGKDRRTALNTAWKASNTSQKQAMQTFRSAKKSDWNTFYTDRKACGAGAASEDSGNAGHDAQP